MYKTFYRPYIFLFNAIFYTIHFFIVVVIFNTTKRREVNRTIHINDKPGLYTSLIV